MFKLEIKTENAAFEDDANEEIARLLEKAAQRLRAGDVCDTLRDANGNTVGKWDTGRKARRMNKQALSQISRLQQEGISLDDALALRRISMTLQRWFELECGDSNNYASWAIVRGRKENGSFVHDDDGKPFIESHSHQGPAKVNYHAIDDRETGARKRLAKIMSRYPDLQAYVQTDPRGAALYILRNSDIPAGSDVSSIYNRGIAVFK